MKIFHNIKYNFFEILNSIIAPLDKLNLNNSEIINNNLRPVFIIGAPRSGTTLLYQLLVKNSNLAYINNFIGNFYKVPVLVSKINSYLPISRNNLTYKSSHGNTFGLSGPNEFGNFWYRWFPRKPQYTKKNTLSNQSILEIRKVMSAIENNLGSPLLFKNVVNSVRVESLLEIFPNCVFLIVKREPLYNIQSIIKIRRKLGKIDKWWSVEPPTPKNLRKLPFKKQCILQVYYLERYLDSFLNNEHASQFKVVNYEDICQDTSQELSRIHQFFKKNQIGALVSYEQKTNLVNRNRQSLKDKEFLKLKKQVNKLWKI